MGMPKLVKKNYYFSYFLLEVVLDMTGLVQQIPEFLNWSLKFTFKSLALMVLPCSD